MIDSEEIRREKLDRILLPLDGSALAEAALAPAAELARLLSAELVLLHVIERGAPARVHGQPHLRDAAAAAAYLDDVARRLAGHDIALSKHVHEPAVGDVAASIAEHAHEIGAGLVVLCTHGSGGLRDLLLGSIAQQVLRQATRPVLVVRPPSPAPARTPTRSAPAHGLGDASWVVALDPVVHGPRALPLAGMLAERCHARLHLVTVVPTLTRLPAERAARAIFSPAATADVLELEAEDARRYMDDLARDLRAAGLQVSVDLRRGDAARETLSIVRRERPSLLVIATHGRAGVGGVLSGSFAAAVVPRVQGNVLLVPIREE